jgi:type IV pilus assembly protein PilW
MNTISRARIDYTLRRQKAFSLIELMIAMAIGLFLLLGLGLILLSVSQTSSAQTQLAQLQDNERMAMTLMTAVIQEAGYFDNTGAGQYTTIASTALPSNGSFNAGQSLFGTHVGAAPGDSISVRFSTQNGDNIVNCQGALNTGVTQVTTNTFYVDGNNYLACSVSINGGAAQVQELISGVTNLQVLYGIDSKSSGSVDSYLLADKLTAVNWSEVRSVQITITFANPLYAPGNGQPQSIVLTRVIQVMNQT